MTVKGALSRAMRLSKLSMSPDKIIRRTADGIFEHLHGGRGQQKAGPAKTR